MTASPRLVAAALVLLLHVVLVAAWMSARFAAGPPPRENIVEMILPPLPPHKVDGKTAAGGPRGTIGAPMPDFRPFAPSANALGLGQVVFGRCQPEYFDRLSAEEREKCERLTGQTYTAYLQAPLKLPPPDRTKLRNSDVAARERNTADPCLIAKLSGTECIHTILFGKGLP